MVVSSAQILKSSKRVTRNGIKKKKGRQEWGNNALELNNVSLSTFGRGGGGGNRHSNRTKVSHMYSQNSVISALVINRFPPKYLTSMEYWNGVIMH